MADPNSGSFFFRTLLDFNITFFLIQNLILIKNTEDTKPDGTFNINVKTIGFLPFLWKVFLIFFDFLNFYLFFFILGGSQHTVAVTSNMTVAQLKEELAKVANIPVSEQRLIHLAKVLKDEHTLDVYRLSEGKTLHLVKRPPPNTTPARPAESQTPSASANPPASNQSAPQAMGNWQWGSQAGNRSGPPQMLMGTMTIPVQNQAGGAASGGRPSISVGVSQVGAEGTPNLNPQTIQNLVSGVFSSLGMAAPQIADYSVNGQPPSQSQNQPGAQGSGNQARQRQPNWEAPIFTSGHPGYDQVNRRLQNLQEDRSAVIQPSPSHLLLPPLHQHQHQSQHQHQHHQHHLRLPLLKGLTHDKISAQKRSNNS